MKKALFIIFFAMLLGNQYLIGQEAPESESVVATQDVKLSETTDQFSSGLKVLVFIAVLAGAFIAINKVLKTINTSPNVTESNPLTLPILAITCIFFFLVVSFIIPALREMFLLMLFDQSGICQVIMVIAVIGITINLFQLFFLKRELKAFDDICSDTTNLDRGSREYKTQIERVMDNQCCGIFMKKWTILKRSMNYLNDSDFTLLVSFPDSMETLKESKISFIVKILPLLGLIGTVLGFVVAVVGMQQAAVNMVDFSSFKGNMLEALGGMQRAFLTTLAGMMAMIAVMFVNSLLSEARRRILLLEDEFLYINIFLPFSSKTLKQETSEE